MHESKVCPGCKAILAPDSAESLCPQCLSAATPPGMVPLGAHEAAKRPSEEFAFMMRESTPETGAEPRQEHRR